MATNHGRACFSTRRPHPLGAYATGMAAIRRCAAICMQSANRNNREPRDRNSDRHLSLFYKPTYNAWAHHLEPYRPRRHLYGTRRPPRAAPPRATSSHRTLRMSAYKTAAHQSRKKKSTPLAACLNKSRHRVGWEGGVQDRSDRPRAAKAVAELQGCRSRRSWGAATKKESGFGVLV